MAIRNTPKEKLYFLVASYFQFWANLSFRRWKPTVIAITGSTGKTTLLQLLEIQLGDKAHYSHDANSIYGIAFDILGLDGVTKSRLEWLRLALLAPLKAFTYTRKQRIYVVEIDGARPGGASKLATWLKPNTTAITNFEESHAEFFDDTVTKKGYSNHLDAIVDEFMSIPRNTKQLILIDNDPTKPVAKAVAKDDHISAKIDGVSEKDWLKSYQVALDGTKYQTTNATYRFLFPSPREVWLQLALVEKVLSTLGEPIKITDLSSLTLPPGRSSVFAGIKNTHLVDSSYNAQLGSMLAVLNMYAHIDSDHKWLVLGDIIELGDREAEQHRILGKYLSSYRADQIILVGRRLKKYTLPAMTNHTGVQSFDNAHQALEYLTAKISGGETILFKGSQHLEWIIEKLLQNPLDSKKLPRQTVADYNRRKKLGYS